MSSEDEPPSLGGGTSADGTSSTSAPTEDETASIPGGPGVPPPPEPLPGAPPPTPPGSAPPAATKRGGLRRAWAIVGIVTGFLYYVVPGIFALRSYRRWRRGEIRSPTFAWVWAWISVPLLVLSVVVGAIVVTTSLTDQLLTANFDNGPGPFTVTTTSCCSFAVVNGTYQISVLNAYTKQQGAPKSAAYLVREAGDVTVTTDVVQITGAQGNDLVGVECSNGGKEGYGLFVGVSKGYGLAKFSSSQSPTSLKVDGSATIPGSGTIESLGLTCNGDPFGPTTIVGWINGVQVAEVQDPQGLRSFNVITLDFAAHPGSTISFDNVMARV